MASCRGRHHLHHKRQPPADLDTLAGFWDIDEKPTGSKDPYALRRAALGVIRIALEAGIRISLGDVLYVAIKGHGALGEAAIQRWFDERNAETIRASLKASSDAFNASGLQDFFRDRLKQQLKDRGARHDLVDAVFALEGQDDLVLIVKRVEALSAFLATDDGRNLLAGYKRAVNILKIEEKKDGKSFDGAPDAKLLAEAEAEEKALAGAIATASKDSQTAVLAEDFAAAMSALAKLRAPVDAFFEKVTVNADEKPVRENRLKLLAQIRAALHTVADFSKVEG